MDHFNGKSVAEHLKEARAKGAYAAVEAHGTEMPGHLVAGLDAMKEIALASLVLWVIGYAILPPQVTLTVLIFFCIGWTIWKTGRSALIGKARIERLHRVIEEERQEITHHRAQEKEELTALYAAKGLSGQLLKDVIEVLMADDNRLLQVMLEEELGLTLEVYEHPLKQSAGAALGAIFSTCLVTCLEWLLPHTGAPIAAVCLLAVSSFLSAHAEKNARTDALIWHLAVAALVSGTVYFFITWFHP